MSRNGGYTASLAGSVTTHTAVRNAPATVGLLHAYNTAGSGVAYLALFDELSTAHATDPRFVVAIKAGEGVALCHLALHVQKGLGLRVTSDYAGSSGAAGAVVVSLALD